MKNKGTHTGSFKRDSNGIITNGLYFFSKWDKEIGEKIVIEDTKTIIEVIGLDRNDTIDQMNIYIKRSNHARRMLLNWLQVEC